MANSELLEILTQGAAAWNTWRRGRRGKKLDLRDANLPRIILCGADLVYADFVGADLAGANLTNVNFYNANLCGVKFNGTNLSGANLKSADLSTADLSGANLNDADLSGADLSGAFLYRADLSGANLSGANIHDAMLQGTNLSRVSLGQTSFGNLDLSEVIGFETATHWAPSTVGIDTLYNSRGKIPDKFLLDAGVPEEAIDLARSIRTDLAIQWESCFISYATKDDEFARRLHARMREANMRVWFAPEDLKGGKKLHEQLFEAIQMHDRLLLVLSEHSILSEWVMTEIRKARETEKREKRRKLFPIRLTDFQTLKEWTCFDADTGKDLAVEVREYFIPDFSNWKDHDAFEGAFARLQKDLSETKLRVFKD